MMKVISIASNNFSNELSSLKDNNVDTDKQIIQAVHHIIGDVRKKGDKALLAYTKKFDNISVDSVHNLEIDLKECEKIYKSIPLAQKNALEIAYNRIYNFHKKQVIKTYTYEDELGNILGWQVSAIQKVGIYVPGGKASYPSSVLMNAIPAKIAGVENITMVVPAPYGKVNDLVLAAAHLVGVNKIIKIGGTQAIAALAYGTESIDAVDKIVGPGNSYVAEAKKQVFGMVDIDMIAGPSEVVIICDGNIDPDWITMDLFAQAEHDEKAQAILLSDNLDFIKKVQKSIIKLLPTLEKKDIIAKSISAQGFLIHTETLQQAVDISNELAPEHLQLSVQNPQQLVKKIKNAGAIFLGYNSCEALGDYCAGPNHILPTNNTARFSQALGVYDFQKRSSILQVSNKGIQKLAPITSVLAEAEGLSAHSKSALYRIRK